MMDIYEVMQYAYKRFKVPKSNLSKAHSVKRACELFAIEEVFEECLNNPFQDYIEIMEDYAFSKELEAGSIDISTSARIRLRYCAKAINILIDYAKTGGKR